MRHRCLLHDAWLEIPQGSLHTAMAGERSAQPLANDPKRLLEIKQLFFLPQELAGG